jgi:hypothetical protein
MANFKQDVLVFPAKTPRFYTKNNKNTMFSKYNKMFLLVSQGVHLGAGKRLLY